MWARGPGAVVAVAVGCGVTDLRQPPRLFAAVRAASVDFAGGRQRSVVRRGRAGALGIRLASSPVFEVKLASGETEAADSLWGARHVIARRVAFAADPTNPAEVLPAEIWKTGANVFGGRVYVETIRDVGELSNLE